MDEQYSYVTKLDILYDHLEKIDVPELVRSCKDKWFNQTLTQVNGSVVRLGIMLPFQKASSTEPGPMKKR